MLNDWVNLAGFGMQPRLLRCSPSARGLVKLNVRLAFSTALDC